jgi:nitrogenase molybdenum-iron protein beta chain
MGMRIENTNSVEQPRTACTIGGIYTALAIERVVPILHAGPGCWSQAGSLIAMSNGGQNADTFMESVIPSTNFAESDVVFGAADRLERTIARSLKYYDADLFVVVDGCVSQIVGDDIEEVVGRFSREGRPVISASLPGFKGNNLYGHSEILKAIINQWLPKSRPKKVNAKQVNVFGIVPFYDTFWAGTLEEIEKALRRLDLEPNIIYGRGKGIAEVERIPEAAFNLILSPWVDHDIAKLLEEKYGTPYLIYPNIPIGPTDTKLFYDKLAAFAKVDISAAKKIIEGEEDRYYYYINHHLRFIYTCRVAPKEFFINSSAGVAVALTKFLINDLGFLPRKIFINENVSEEYHEKIYSHINACEWESKGEDGAGDIEVIFTNDGGLCDTYVKSEDTTFRKTLLLGTTWDELTAKNLKLPFVSVSSPYGDLMIGAKHFFGFDGALNLVADIYNDTAEKGLGTII